MKLSILIPAYNEARTIHLILDKISHLTLLQSIQKEIIIVNDCSKDATQEIIEKYIIHNELVDGILPVNYRTIDN